MISIEPRRLLTVLSVYAVIAIAGLLALMAYYDYKRVQSAFYERLAVEVRLLAEHAELSLHAADLVLAELEADLRRDGLEALSGDHAYWLSLRETLEHLPQLTSLVIADADGRVRVSSVSFSAPDQLVGDRNYFAAHRDGRTHYIGAPILGRATKRPVIPISKRIEIDGRFSGVVLATLDVGYFLEFYRSVPKELDRRIGMLLYDGEVLVLHPEPEGRLPRAALTNVIDPDIQRRSAVYVDVSPLDQVENIIAYRYLDGYPIVVSVSTEFSTFLSLLYPGWVRAGLIFLVFSSSIGIATVVLKRSMRTAAHAREEQFRLERRQRESERLAQAVTQHLPNGRVALLDRQLCYVFAEGEGLSTEPEFSNQAVLGKTLAQVFPADIAAALERCARDAFQGQESETAIDFKGQSFKIIVVPLEGEEGRIDRCLLLTQDITDLRRAQQELELRNRQLEELASTDGLLNIANRRTFDETLQQEWRRAARMRSSLALLLVDVDNFKQFNDHYGHAEGDRCLQRVATALEEATERAGDMVARYGGEELAVLLPNCDLNGALHVAERIHNCLAKAAIPFPDSPVADAVTVSIGAAVMQPQSSDTPAELVERADQALYVAKENGRARTEHA